MLAQATLDGFLRRTCRPDQRSRSWSHILSDGGPRGPTGRLDMNRPPLLLGRRRKPGSSGRSASRRTRLFPPVDRREAAALDRGGDRPSSRLAHGRLLPRTGQITADCPVRVDFEAESVADVVGRPSCHALGRALGPCGSTCSVSAAEPHEHSPALRSPSTASTSGVARATDLGGQSSAGFLSVLSLVRHRLVV